MGKSENLKWATKLMKAKSFAVLTDKEAFIMVDVLNARSPKNRHKLLVQQAELHLFLERLQTFTDDYDRAVWEVIPGARIASVMVQRKRKPTAKKKVTKIPVKQG